MDPCLGLPDFSIVFRDGDVIGSEFLKIDVVDEGEVDRGVASGEAENISQWLRVDKRDTEEPILLSPGKDPLSFSLRISFCRCV